VNKLNIPSCIPLKSSSVTFKHNIHYLLGSCYSLPQKMMMLFMRLPKGKLMTPLSD